MPPDTPPVSAAAPLALPKCSPATSILCSSPVAKLTISCRELAISTTCTSVNLETPQGISRTSDSSGSSLPGGGEGVRPGVVENSGAGGGGATLWGGRGRLRRVYKGRQRRYTPAPTSRQIPYDTPPPGRGRGGLPPPPPATANCRPAIEFAAVVTGVRDKEEEGVRERCCVCSSSPRRSALSACIRQHMSAYGAPHSAPEDTNIVV